MTAPTKVMRWKMHGWTAEVRLLLEDGTVTSTGYATAAAAQEALDQRAIDSLTWAGRAIGGHVVDIDGTVLAQWGTPPTEGSP